jgi:hypothetical protein
MNDHDLLLAIQELLDGVEWTPSTLDQIADLMTANEYEIHSIDSRSRIFRENFDDHL